jgi:hypothetical protein
MTTSRTRTFLLGGAALLATAALAAPASGAMHSERLADGTCLTTGGGRFVNIPDFPGERVDVRLLTDLQYLEQRYKVFVTDGLSDDPVHAAGGEHPIGLALDLVPNTAVGGTWRDITALAKFAEPVQNQPVPPFRWVGYNGDEGHGRGNHLHLSWSHSDTKAGHPARSVYTMFCPGAAIRGGGGPTTPTGGGNGGGGKHDGPSGGVEPGAGTGGTSGGIGVGRARRSIDRMGPPVVERGE